MGKTKGRFGFTMVELIATIAIIGLLGGLSISLFPKTMGAMGTKVEARRLYRDLLQTRSRAIATGDDHQIAWMMRGRTRIGYRIERIRDNGEHVTVDDPHLFSSEDVKVKLKGGTNVRFTFEGRASGASAIYLYSAHNQWDIHIESETGFVTRSEGERGAFP